MQQWRRFVGMFLLGLCVPYSTLAQNYPAKPVRIVTVAPGSANDIVARLIAQELRPVLGQTVIVDNRGTIAAEVVARAPADGYTLLLYGSAVWLSPFIRSNTPYDPVKDFAPLTLVASSPNIVVAHPSLPVKSVRELIAFARARPGQLNYAAGSLGAAPHLAAELFKAMGKLNIVRVAYKGTGGSLIGILSGEVELMFPTAGSVTPHIKAGKLRALAVTSLQPTALAPGLPLLADALPGYESVSLNGMFAPAKTPDPVIRQLNQEITRIMTRPEVKEKLVAAGTDAMATTPEEFAATIKSEMAKWGALIRNVGIRE
ncbi:MAG: tripartite tricarboxylate transporter substrate binding protein [Burkholderiales bacterium]|jgi:tripartite-type tricarboxylate transporter receptor subunit TctC|nr:tripartite tricarboxylate transporter substrate binding protein [Burkholderiales bacterium]